MNKIILTLLITFFFIDTEVILNSNTSAQPMLHDNNVEVNDKNSFLNSNNSSNNTLLLGP